MACWKFHYKSQSADSLEHEGHQLTPADFREIDRSVNADTVRRHRFREMMLSPAYQWKKPAPRRQMSINKITFIHLYTFAYSKITKCLWALIFDEKVCLKAGCKNIWGH
ncbi:MULTISPECIES: hypothetical protein [unclassified Enterobacter]|uniref:hypothetical protein n=1 Tax=unclassified Enterobacter TaxID=2608935 RepID=UPI0038557537